MHGLIFIFLLFLAPPTLAGEVTVAVAANFKQTATSISEVFEVQTGHRVNLSSASTGVLHSQITHGAPFDIFLSADSHSPSLLQTQGYGVAGQRFCYARGQLILTGGTGSLKDLGDSKLSLAMANPRTAPYGKAAQQVIHRKEFASGKDRTLVQANNVVHAYQYLVTGSVDMSLVAQSLTPGQGIVIPQDWYTPIEQQALLLTPAKEKPAALEYVAFLKSSHVRALIADSGYGPCQ
ncbi:MAG: molybdate ABC transporter substrate-binding protein [Halioglobus sp.]